MTRPLIERYLELRNRKNPCTDILIISEDGEPLQADGCRGAVKAHCERLGVKTYDGQIPTPHRLRHSFGTLNAERIGICLTVKQIKNQLRHTSTEITEKIYIAQNTVLKTLDYEATMRHVDAAGEQNSNATGNLSNSSSSHPQAAPHVASKSTDKVIPEVEAIRMIHKLGVNYKTLRQYCLEANKATQNGRGYDYSHPFIADLADNHMTAQEAMDLLKMSKSAFFRWRNREGIDCIQIGQVGLYRQDQILQKKRAG